MLYSNDPKPDQEECQKIKELIYETAPKFQNAQSIEAFFELYQTMAEEPSLLRVVNIQKSPEVDPALIEELKRRNYPADFVDLMRKRGNFYIEFGSGRMNDLSFYLECADSNKCMLTRHGYLRFAGDGGGNWWVFDLKNPDNPIGFADHNEVWWDVEEATETLGENYDVWYDSETGEYSNDQGIDLSLAFDAEHNVLLDSPYFRKHFEEAVETDEATSFLDWLKAMMEKQFKELADLANFDYPEKEKT